LNGARFAPCFTDTIAICANQIACRYFCITANSVQANFALQSTASLDEPTQRRRDSSSQTWPSYVYSKGQEQCI
ncbi:hypothetical protein BD309DRAFT_856249, partial [Dichomitus squalens]